MIRFGRHCQDGLARCLRRFVSHHRRWLPFGLSALVLIICLAPLYSDRIDALTADLYTLPLASGVFAFMAVMFGWLRYRMVTDSRPMTVFGLSLVDFFTAHIVLAAVWSGVYLVLFWWAKTHPGEVQPTDIRTINRATIIAGGALIVSTGIAVAYELRRAGIDLAVHQEDWDGERERRTGPVDRRKVEA